jgi:PhzF family phenazine biosynthesis protein
MAGHPLVGTAWVLRRLGWIGDAAVLSAPGGEVAVEADDDGARMTRTGPGPRGQADAAALAGLLGVRALGPAPIWDAGMSQVMLEVDDLAALRPDHEGLRARGDAEGWAGVSAYTLRDEPPGTGTGTHENAPVAEVRHFAAPIGIAEDPVTGSAAAALGACLAAKGLIGGAEPALTVLQGHHMGRPGRVDVRVHMGPDGPDAVTVGGAVIPAGTGAVGPTSPAG